LVIVVAVLVIVAIVHLSKVSFIRRTLDYWIQHSLQRAGLVRAMDYELLLRIERGYCVSECVVEDSCPIANKSLGESRPWDHGVVILAIRRNDDFLPGIPNRAEFIYPNDVVTLYGEEHAITKLMQSTKESSIS